MREKFLDKFIRVLCAAFVCLFALLCIFPFIYVITDSLEPYPVYLKNPAALFPGKISFAAYRQLLHFHLIWSGFSVTLFITFVGTVVGVFLLLVSAYPLSKTDLKGRNVILALITFTMFFNGGMIPNYYLIHNLHMLNTIWALILPGLMSAYNLIVMKSFVANIPASLEEAAMIDGANELKILFRIIIPLCTPAIATFCVLIAVGYWNAYFNAIIYTTSRNLWPMTLVLRELVVEEGTDLTDPTLTQNPYTLKMAAIIITALPIICVYPFAQKYFTKGIMLGSVKG